MNFLGYPSRQAIFVLSLAIGVVLLPLRATAQFIAATAAFDNSPACSSVNPNGDDWSHVDPEWKAISIDPNHPLPNNPPTILEGIVPPSAPDEASGSQAPSEVSEEEIPWNHYTHDFTFKVVPDTGYAGLLSSWVTPDGKTGVHSEMEVEWENASLMDEGEGFQRIWGAVPEFVWPAVGDRVWVEGRWVFDCGHPGAPDDNTAHVQFSTEIHPPRVLVTFRLNHPALDSFPVPRPSAPNFAGPQSYLPVTGEPVDLPPDVNNSGPTNVPVTEADIFVSGNGGGANDICNIRTRPCAGSSGPTIPVNDQNYVFDIYPPGTGYFFHLDNGTFPVSPPVPDASLQWRVINHRSELPAHTCGEQITDCYTDTVDYTPDPILCLVGASTPPPPSDPVAQTQLGTTCPTLQPGERPTRLRVILPFFTDASQGKVDRYFAQSILLGWDDVPAPPDTSAVRTFKVTLHKFTVVENGEGSPPLAPDGDWRVFVNVGGQYRYMSHLFDRNNDGKSACDGADELTENGDNDCYLFDNTPWIVSIQDGTPIHVAVGGFESDRVDSHFCRSYPFPDYNSGQCVRDDELDPAGNSFALLTSNDDRIGTYEFDLNAPDYKWILPDGSSGPGLSFTTQEPHCDTRDLLGIIPLITCDEVEYTVEFRVDEVPAATPPASQPLQIGDPHYNNYMTSATPITLSSSDTSAQGFQYRFHLQGGSLPTYTSSLPFPVHWANANLSNGQSLQVYLNGVSAVGDGTYDFQYSANSFADLLEPRHTQTVNLDNTPPVATMNQPTASQYGHSDTITLNYSVSDGSGSGVKSFTPKMDGQTASQFCAASNPTCLDSGQPIYLYSMSLASHTFSVDSVDNLNNAGTNSVTFTVTVTPDSLKGDVSNLPPGCIDNISQSLIAKISATGNLVNKGQYQAAINTLAALIYEVQAQAGKHISTSCKDPSGRTFDPTKLLIGDAQYLQGILAGQLKPNPIFGSVVNSSNVGMNGVTVNVVNSKKTIIATAVTDSVGFCYFADTSILTVGASYAVNASLPKGYKSSTPSSQTFTWKGNQVTLSNFVLN